jgi:CDGSH-type Zn-finger protein
MQPKIIENLQNSEGKQLSTIVGIALCRCGASKNNPFCDGMYKVINFKDDKN